METIFFYLLKSCSLIIVFYLTYFFLLRRETFFTSNRWFLLFGLFTSVLLPLLFFTKIIWIEPTINQMDWSKIPTTKSTEKNVFEINWYIVAAIVYMIGILISLIKFIFDFFSLTKILKGKTIQQQSDFKLIDVKENVAPFSYFNNIVHNSTLYSASELENILEHEKVHSAQNHTIDVLISRIFCIFFWYNPFIWLYKKAILQNLEFIADSEATKNIVDKKSYQITLLKITTHENCVEITNHFYQSLIKKRIVMLNKNQSKKWNSWKYAIIIPALVAFVLLFQIKVIAQEKVIVTRTEKNISNQQVIVVIDKNASDASLKQDAINLKNNHGITLNVSKVKRNAKGEITGIKVAFKDDKGNNGVNQVNGDKPIKPITFVKNMDENGKGEVGFYTNNNESHAIRISGEDYINAVAVIEETKHPESTQSPIRTEKRVIVKRSSNEAEPTIYINGEKVDINIEELSEMDPQIIKVMEVYKGDQAVNRYGNNAKNGVISITTDEDFKIRTEELERARIEMDRARPEMERAMREMEISKPELEKAKAEMIVAKIEMENAKMEMEKAKAEMTKARIEMEKQKK